MLFTAGVLPGLNTYAFDISAGYDPSSWYAAVLGGMFNFTAQPSVLEVIAWVAYAVIVLALFLGPTVLRRLRPSTPTSAPVETAASTH